MHGAAVGGTVRAKQIRAGARECWRPGVLIGLACKEIARSGRPAEQVRATFSSSSWLEARELNTS